MTYVGPKDSGVFAKDFFLEVARGNVRGHSSMNKFGQNPDVDIAAPEDIWDFGGTYNFSTAADIDTISSSDVDDTEEITIEGLDENWAIKIQTATLNGQNKVTLGTSLIRVYRAYNSNSVNLEGNVYIYKDGAITTGVPDTDADVRAMIRIGTNQTLMCIYTVPAGKTAYFLSGYVALAGSVHPSGVIADMSWRARPFGGIFQVKSRLAINETGSSSWMYRYGVPVALPEKSDIKIVCDSVSDDNTSIAGGFDLILIDN